MSLKGEGGVRKIRDKEDLRLEFNRTVSERQVFDQKIREMRAELRLLETSQQALVQHERWLQREMAHAPEATMALEDFLSGDASPINGPQFFHLQDPPEDEAHPETEDGEKARGGAAPSPSSSQDTGAPLHDGIFTSDGDGEGSAEDQAMEDWETSLDNMGIAKCRQCGLRMPLDVGIIEKHTKDCTGPNGSATGSEGLSGRCSICGTFLPLSVEGISRHECYCTTTTAKAEGKQKEAPSARKRLSFGFKWPSQRDSQA